MNTPTPVIKGQYFRDLLAQPQAMQDTLAWLAQGGRWAEVRSFVGSRSWKRIVLTGMGSSCHGLQTLYLPLIGSGRSALLIETSELIHSGMTLCDENTLIVAVSQSGASAELVRLLDLNRQSPVLGITNTAGSPLAARADLALLTQAGVEYTVSCKTYVSALLVLQWLAAIFAGAEEAQVLRRLAPASTLTREYWQHWPTHTAGLSQRLRGLRHLFLTGRGSSLAAVGTGALILKESARFHAEGMSSAAFRHGPLEMLQADMMTVVFSGEAHTRALNVRLASELTGRGEHCELLGSDSAFGPLRLPSCDALLGPIMEIAPVQMISLALAALAGREAGAFEHARKITDTE